MDYLRLSLLIIGVIVIAIVFVVSRAQSRPRKNKSLFGSVNPEDVTILPEVPIVFPDTSDDAAQQLEGIFASRGVQSEDMDQGASAPETAQSHEEKIIVLHVLAQDGQVFAGPGIQQAAFAAGLHHGEMDIFHYRGSDDQGEAIFSMANAVEPGTFDLKYMAEFTTTGLVFFLRLPGPLDSMDALERFIVAVKSMTDTLEGKLCDSKREILTEEMLDTIKQDISK
jgi:cell division protein ZipA